MTISVEPNIDRIQELEAKVTELTALVERLAPAAMPNTIPVASSEAEAPVTSSRRGMLKLAGAAAVGAAAVAVAGNATPAAAADGDFWKLGFGNNATTATTLIGTVQVLAASSTQGTILSGFGGTLSGWDTSNEPAVTRGGVVGLAGPFIFAGTTTAHGVVGRMFNGAGTGSGVLGLSEANGIGISAGVRALSNNGPAVQLIATFTGAPTTGTWTRVPSSPTRPARCGIAPLLARQELG